MNVITVMLDTLRPDFLGCYGNQWIKTPNLGEFSANVLLPGDSRKTSRR